MKQIKKALPLLSQNNYSSCAFGILTLKTSNAKVSISSESFILKILYCTFKSPYEINFKADSQI